MNASGGVALVLTSLALFGCGNVKASSSSIFPSAQALATFEPEAGTVRTPVVAQTAVVATAAQASNLGAKGSVIGLVRTATRRSDYGLGIQATPSSSNADAVAALTAAREGATHLIAIEPGSEARLCLEFKKGAECNFSASSPAGGRVYVALAVPVQAWTELEVALRPTALPGVSVPPASAVGASMSMSPWLPELGRGVSHRNDEAAGTAPTNQYSRLASENSRFSPFDIEYFAFGKSESLHQREAVRNDLEKIYREIYSFNNDAWDAELKAAGAPLAQRQTILRSKANRFWEQLAQDFAERVFGISSADSVLTVGPKCLGGCAVPPGIPGADRVVVMTHVSALRDPMLPVSRTITTSFRAADFSHPEVTLSVDIPKELLPTFRDGTSPKKVELWVRTIAQKAGVSHPVYVDYSFVYVPYVLRVLRGKAYADKAQFVNASYGLMRELNDEKSAKKLSSELSPEVAVAFANYKITDLNAFGRYVFGEVAQGLGDRIAEVRIRVDGEWTRESGAVP